MIAKNLRKFAEAFALQLPLPFGRLRMLKQARPTTRAGRAARAARRIIRAAALKIRVLYRPRMKKAPRRAPEFQTMFQLAFALANLENMDLAGF
ncbi:hypothetical protein [Aquabacterium sp. CECT 9606]|uniref:hypothetical protein n=1 Tax=Aquabacterium sp. CECT 9606 TaxID=2845822 RepID=UPI001E6034F9|nr:hypothetical protein [Aquabacterium sp. CECT 9606]CAH0352827.1 hypothetical protein AQB9606_02834 [Aquabacterium sp. CECT 9606]